MSTYLRLLKFLRPHLRVFAIAVVCMAFSAVLGGVQLGALMPLCDKIFSNRVMPIPAWLPGWLTGIIGWVNAVQPMQFVTAITIAIPIMFFLKGLFEFWQTYYMNETAQRVIRDLRQALFDRYLALSVDYHAKATTGTLTSRILYDAGIVQNSITEGVSDLVFQTFQIIVCLGWALSIDWKMALAIFIVAPIIAWPIASVGKMLKKLSQQSQVAMAHLNTTIYEALTGIRVIQAFLAEPAVRAKFKAANERSYRLMGKLQKRINALAPVTELVGACAGAAFFYIGSRRVLLGGMTPGTLILFLAAMLSVIRPFKRLARLHGINQQALASAERIFEVLDTPSTVVEHPQARHLAPFQNEIVFEHVSFHYDTKPALRDVLLNVSFAESVALVGPSGGGKTTLVNLLPRFFDPSAGRVKIDGVDIRNVTLSSLRAQIALVTQETFLFNDSVRANIALGKPNADLTEIVEAAKLANAHDFISRLRHGYDTIIGERGGQLSGGERQRLAIARAFLKNPSILILDEATSQLDAESEHLISDAVARLTKGRTVLLIAHRLSTVRLAHRIVMVQEGRIVDSGSHDELLQKNQLYRRFCELQLIKAGDERQASS